MRFLHLADLHLDTLFAGRSPELRARLRDATLEALAAAVDRALAERVDAVLIAGDLFDGERLSFRTERRLMSSLRRLIDAGISVIYATGNHDPGGAGGQIARIRWPEGMHVVAEPEPKRFPIEREGHVVGWVTASGHATSHEGGDLSRLFGSPPGELPEVALLHTQVMGSRGEGEHDRYAPSELPHLRDSGYDYWALGHIHLRQTLSTDPAIHYPGNLQGRHPGESGRRGGLLVELERGSAARVDFVELAPIRWETLRVGSIEGAHQPEALLHVIRRAWEAARLEDPGAPGTEWILRVRLEGASPLHRELSDPGDRGEVERELGVGLGLLDVEIRVEGVHPPVDPDAHEDRIDVLGESLALLRSLEKDGAMAGATLGVTAGDLAALEGAELDRYLAELLRGEAASVVAALLEPEDRS